ncbi:unnamed protein product [Mytilus edulis]|uniref:Uncharacterized protein n=1 Tax=Mytilus edulis TaxID=6550 RepID=A0A8S3QY88_MYTED|nr:unnamed protein product [Mytilus edulis]
MILNQFDSSFMVGFDGNPLSQIGAGDYVQTVMAPNSLVNINSQPGDYKSTVSTIAEVYNTPKSAHAHTHTPRKRRLSESDETASENKKMKSSGHPPVALSDTVTFNALANMITNLIESMNNLGSRLEKRISEIEGNVEKRLTVKFNTVINDRVKGEVAKLKAEITSEVSEYKDKVETLEKSYAEIVTSKCDKTDQKQNLNIIVKNLSVEQRENTDKTFLKSKVAALIKDGLKLANVSVKDVVRKQTYPGSTKPGIVIIGIESLEQKKLVLKSKKVLMNSAKYSRVYIENDIPYEQRINNINNRTILRALGKDNDFVVKSGRIVKKQFNNTSINDVNIPQRTDDQTKARKQNRNDKDSYSKNGKAYENSSDGWQRYSGSNRRGRGRGGTGKPRNG